MIMIILHEDKRYDLRTVSNRVISARKCRNYKFKIGRMNDESAKSTM